MAHTVHARIRSVHPFTNSEFVASAAVSFTLTIGAEKQDAAVESIFVSSP